MTCCCRGGPTCCKNPRNQYATTPNTWVLRPEDRQFFAWWIPWIAVTDVRYESAEGEYQGA